MLDLIDRFWVEVPVSYAMSVGGLLAGFRRGGQSDATGVSRALVTGIPVLLGAVIAWNIIVALAEAPGVHEQFRGLESLLGLIFIASSSALTGSCTDPLISCSGVTLVGDTHEHGDGRRDQEVDSAA